MKRHYLQHFLLGLIIILACIFRFNNLDWDSGQHLHPDERFLTMVGNAMKWPITFEEYIDPAISKLNPANIGFNFYVYGIFPLTFAKYIAINIGMDDYASYTLLGRALSGILDLVALVFIYKIARLLYKHTKDHVVSIPLWTAFFYAIAVMPIQLSHFFAVDTFLNAFMMIACYFSLKFYYKRGWENVVMSAVAFGLGLASKLTAVFILPLIFLFFSYNTLHQLIQPFIYRSKKEAIDLRDIGFTSAVIGSFFLIGYIVLRVANPYMFETSNIFNPQLSQLFIHNLEALKSFEGQHVWFPPAVQWMNKPPVTFALQNIAFFGLGIPFFILTIIGMISVSIHAIKEFKAKKIQALTFMLIWVIAFFFYQSIQFVKNMRYFIFVYPFFALFAAYGLNALTKVYQLSIHKLLNPSLPVQLITEKTVLLKKALIIFLVLIWPVAFSSIYTQKHSRIVASEWIYKHLDDKQLLVWEHWDDPLPLLLPNNYGKTFRGESLPVFDEDTPQKWQQMNSLLDRAQYYVLSSNRAWGSIPTVPAKYPLTSRYYEELFAEQLGFTKIQEFTSYPTISLFGWKITFPDDWADESFTVYDHPKVIIMQKMSSSKGFAQSGEFSCEQFNNNFDGCVQAQQEAKGCAWFAQCNACAKDGSDLQVVCR